MKFDLEAVLQKIENLSPVVARKIVIQYLNMASPFNSHLNCTLVKWSNTESKIRVKLHRGVKNHLGGVHAGALFTLGETCAGILIVKNFNPQKYRIILKDASIIYLKQARETVYGGCSFSEDKISQAKSDIASGEPAFIEALTLIKNEENEDLCQVKTNWQIKNWDNVKLKG
ncbi:MAG: YiiD C-terminal domain-containing protein [Oligoflexia bacterium]|nr:YiiD C-terminal domain-containing protein [Oligoflexia bacterium]